MQSDENEVAFVMGPDVVKCLGHIAEGRSARLLAFEVEGCKLVRELIRQPKRSLIDRLEEFDRRIKFLRKAYGV